jgi:hypothetical protein
MKPLREGGERAVKESCKTDRVRRKTKVLEWLMVVAIEVSLSGL